MSVTSPLYQILLSLKEVFFSFCHEVFVEIEVACQDDGVPMCH